MPAGPLRWFILTLDTIRTAALGVLLSATLGLGLAVPLDVRAPAHETSAQDVQGPDILSLMREHRCSATGFDPDRTPASALIRTGDGRIRLVSYSRGWAVYTGDRPGTLVAICLDDLPPRAGA